MMNPADLLFLYNAKKTFSENHPKVTQFCSYVLSRPMEEGTVIRMEVTRPGSNPVATSMQVTASDLELLEKLKTMAKKQK